MIQKYFDTVTDKRQAGKVRHKLHEIIIMVICAVVAECEAWYQIEHYCKSKKETEIETWNTVTRHVRTCFRND